MANSTLTQNTCILCQRACAAWLVRLPLADRQVHKACADRWYKGERRIWPGLELCQQWLADGPTWIELAYMTLVPRVFKVGAEIIPPGFWPRGQNGASPSPKAHRVPCVDPRRFAFSEPVRFWRARLRGRSECAGLLTGASCLSQPRASGFCSWRTRLRGTRYTRSSSMWRGVWTMSAEPRITCGPRLRPPS